MSSVLCLDVATITFAPLFESLLTHRRTIGIPHIFFKILNGIEDDLNAPGEETDETIDITFGSFENAMGLVDVNLVEEGEKCQVVSLDGLQVRDFGEITELALIKA